jgi:ABC-type transport system involved in multi-copper enzyme maturation permease subunit
MRPYFAIVKDSFREALHSRVLWIVLIIITLFLGVSSLLSYRQTLTVGVHEGDIRFPELVELLKKAKDKQGNRGAQRIYELMSSKGQEAVEKFKPLKPAAQLKDVNEFTDVVKAITRDLNDILNREDLYQSTSFSNSTLRFEGKELVRREKDLAKDERQRLNRLLLESAFGDAIERSEATSLQFRAAWFDLFRPFPISKTSLVSTLMEWVPWLVDKFVLSGGLLLAIMVTAPTIPHTFDPGSLHLLLSKPVSRTMLYLSKFFGSCAFVLLFASYLFVGVYFVLGVRWSVWEARLLWCIPIYTFVFAVYYSVAALAGLIWRNVIVSILAAMLFWLLCTGIGLGKWGIEQQMDKYRLRQVIPVGESLVAVDGTNTPYAWSAEKKRWNIVFLSREMKDFQSFLSFIAALPPMQGPVYDPKEKRLVGVLMSISNGQQLLATAKEEDGFSYKEGPASPFSPLFMLNEPDGQPLLITSGGLYRLQGDLGVTKDEIKLLGYKIPLPASGPLRYVSIYPAPVFEEPFTATFGPDGTLYTYSRGKLQNFARSGDGKYTLLKTEKFEGKSKRRARLAAGKSALLVGFNSGKLELRDPQTLELKDTLEPAPGERPRDAAASPDGQWIAVVLESRKLWLLKDGEQQFKQASVGGQGDISAVEFTREGKMLVVDLGDRVTEYEPGSWNRARRFSPPLQISTIAYHYIVNPIYLVCPKPGEFYKTVQHLLLDPADMPEAAAGEDAEQGGEATTRKIDKPWQPVYSSALFMAAMLAIGCLYMEWQEF